MGPIFPSRHKLLHAHIAGFRLGTHPNLTAVVRQKCLEGGIAIDSDNDRSPYCILLREGRACMEPAFVWFEEKFGEMGMSKQMQMYRAAAYVDPRQVSLLPETSDEQHELLMALVVVPGISEDTVHNLVQDLPAYLARVGTDPVSNHVQEPEDGADNALQRWWIKHGPYVGSWGAAYCACLLLIPSSACAERVFSLLKATFTSDMLSSHEDYREVTVQLQFTAAKIKRDR